MDSSDQPPAEFVEQVGRYAPGTGGVHAAQLLWQRGIRQPEQLAGFLDPNHYQPASPFEFGEEMQRAIARLQQAIEQQEKVAIWGDFDADGVTATAVLWEGLGEFFAQCTHLTYHIPNRLVESHGLAIAGIDTLATQGYTLIVTCDTGSTNLDEIHHAGDRGIDIIITDHHTLPAERPPVSAIINPRYLATEHPLANLSGVAVAYKLVEALYATLPHLPKQPLENLLDLVAIGLIADLVNLTGDGRYLAQRGIEQLQKNRIDLAAPRPGVAKLLEYCRATGDRPTDISFGIGPRINAISRIHGDARFGVELLTSHDVERCNQLALETELANTRRKALQRDVVKQVKARLSQLDLSTTQVIVLVDEQWPVGILGLVAGQIAQEYGRPTILLSTERAGAEASSLARGSARSINQIDLYQLIKGQEHLLKRFGGHPFAAGMSLAVDNIPLFTEALNRQMRQQADLGVVEAQPQADLVVTVSDLGKDLFRELKLLEPYGMGNPVPRLLIRNCWFTHVRNRNISDRSGRKLQYIKTEFRIWDETAELGFPGIWWEHYTTDIPSGRCEAIAELDFRSKEYEIRLVSLQPQPLEESFVRSLASIHWLIDARTATPDPEALILASSPADWEDLHPWFRQALAESRPLAIAFPPPTDQTPTEIWMRLLGIAKYLSRTAQVARSEQIMAKLGISDRALRVGLTCLRAAGFVISETAGEIAIQGSALLSASPDCLEDFYLAIQEEQFRRRYFYTAPFSLLQAAAVEFCQTKSVG